MEFLKELFDKSENGALTYEQFANACEQSKIKLANLSTGEYVSKGKYDADISSRDTQISTLNSTLSTRDNDLSDLRTKLQNAGTDATKLSELTNQFDTLKSKYQTDTETLKNQLEKQAYEFAVKEYANTKDFTSSAAKRDFINSMITQNLTMKDNKILGADDFVKSYLADNADAFAVKENQEPEAPKPQFVDVTQGMTQSNTDTNKFHFNFFGVRSHENNK